MKEKIIKAENELKEQSILIEVRCSGFIAAINF